MIQNLGNKMELQINSLETRIEKMHKRFNKDLEEIKMSQYMMNNAISSVAQLCPTLCDPMNCRMPGLPVHHQFPEFTQTHIHRVSDAIQPSHPLSSPYSPAPNPSQHQSFPMSQLFA